VLLVGGDDVDDTGVHAADAYRELDQIEQLRGRLVIGLLHLPSVGLAVGKPILLEDRLPGEFLQFQLVCLKK
jgi:hypothetical protein